MTIVSDDVLHAVRFYYLLYFTGIFDNNYKRVYYIDGISILIGLVYYVYNSATQQVYCDIRNINNI